jgi:HPt (histidine-containing phosphotransfer) domain-containing protein
MADFRSVVISGPATSQCSGGDALGPAINLPALIERCLGNISFSIAMLEQFESTGLECTDSISRAASHGNWSELAQATHTLTGVAGTLGAEQLCRISQELNSVAHEESVSQAAALAQRLQIEMQRCLREIPLIRKECQSRS